MCALLSNGTVECWGYNGQGQLGNGGTTNEPSPGLVQNLGGTATALATGESHSCVVLSTGAVQCWGDNTYGELGGTTSTTCNGTKCATTPVTVPSLSNATAVAVGRALSCALISGGTVKCWGDNSLGELGNNMLGTSSSMPVPVSNLTGVTAIAVGGFHACALKSDSTVWCWGDDTADELGYPESMTCDGSSSEFCSPVPMESGADIAQTVAAAGPQTCAVEGGDVECWGTNSSGLGDGATTESIALVGATGISSAKSVSVGDGTACALISGGTVECWGAGPLGNGTTASSASPMLVSNLSNATAVAVTVEGACVILTTGAVSCWSGNDAGDLGNGTSTPSLTPIPITL